MNPTPPHSTTPSLAEGSLTAVAPPGTLPMPPAARTGWPWTAEQTHRRPSLTGALPRITIVTPSYNQATFIEEALRSVLMQGYPNLEYIVMDGGSTDASVEVIKQYEPWLTSWVSQKDGGQADAVNKGWAQATGDILGFINSDDLLTPNALWYIAEAVQQHPDARLLYGDCLAVGRERQPLLTRSTAHLTRERLLAGDSLHQPSVFIHRDVLRDVGYLDTSLHYALDWAYFLHIAYQYPPEQAVYIPHILSMSREYGDTKSQLGFEKHGRERRSVLDRFFRDGILPDQPKLRRAGVAGTYWDEGSRLFLARHYKKAFASTAKAVHHDPASLFYKLYRLRSFIREFRRRST